MKIKLSNEDIRKALDIENPKFPKYVTQILNLANQNAQGTRPKVVGQMSELIKECDGKILQQWEEWYVKRHPASIKDATDKIEIMVEKLKDAIRKIDRAMIEAWVEDLVITKTFLGFKFQEAILKKGAGLLGVAYELASPLEESKGIDGYIGGLPVSIKPDTYSIKKALPEDIGAKTIYYKKVKDGIEADYRELS